MPEKGLKKKCQERREEGGGTVGREGGKSEEMGSRRQGKGDSESKRSG